MESKKRRIVKGLLFLGWCCSWSRCWLEDRCRVYGQGGGGGARTGGKTCASTGTSGATCALTGSSCAVFRDFLCLELEVPRVLSREEPVILPPLLGFPVVGTGEAGVDVTCTWKMGSPPSSNKEPVLTVQLEYFLIGFTFVAKF